MAITVVAGKSRSTGRFELRNGGQAVLMVTSDTGVLPAGGWQKDGTTIVGQTGPSLLLTMSSSGVEAGSYTYQPGDGTAAASAVTIEKRSLFASLLHAPALLTLLLVAVLYGCGAGVLLSGWIGASKYQMPAAITARAYGFATLTLIIFLLLVELSGRVSQGGGSGLVGLFAGSDQRASTSKFQYLLWTFLLGFVLAYVAARTSITNSSFTCVGKSAKNCIPAHNWTSYLLLLGLPSGVAVVAKGVMSYKVQNQTVQKTDAVGGFAVTDLATDDAGSPDLVDIQYLLFNLIAAAYVLTAFIGKGSLPDIPDLLLGLTSAAAGTYVLNKSLQTNAPVITSVVPSLLLAGQTIRVTGQNLFPAGSPSDIVDVIAGGVRTPGTRVAGTASDTLTFIAPDGMAATDPTVHVITGAQVQTDGFPITYGAIAIYGWASSVPAAAEGTVGLRLGGLPDDLAGKSIVVRINGLTSSVTVVENSTVEVHKPATTAPSVDVSVFWETQTATATLPVLPP